MLPGQDTRRHALMWWLTLDRASAIMLASKHFPKLAYEAVATSSSMLEEMYRKEH
jgi:hypothetical protein